MNFLKFFGNNYNEHETRYNDLFKELSKTFPDLEEKELVIASCISGLLARVAYVDFHLDPKEVEEMDNLIQGFDFNLNIDSAVLANMAITHIKDMAGLDNHLYVHPLREILSQDERYKVLQSLFLVAASDGNVDNLESEEIRIICKGLELSNQHFTVARAEVAKYIGALK